MKTYMKVLWGLVIFLAAMLLIGIIGSAGSSSSNRQSRQTVSMTEDQVIQSTVEDIVGDRFVKITYAGFNNHVLIEFNAKDNLGGWMTVVSMLQDMEQIMKELADLEIDMSFIVNVCLVKDTGETYYTQAINAEFSNETRQSINWDNFLRNNLPNVADDWWAIPQVTNELQ